MTKKEIRSLYKQKRFEWSAEEREIASLSIYRRLLMELNLDGKKVSVFLPIERFGEVNSKHFLASLNSTQFYLPVVKANRDLVHIAYESGDQIQVSEWGIPEPKYGEEVSPEIFDYVFVPLLAIDQNGYRVGYGKGFYDKFLSQCSPTCQFIGLSYFDPIDAIDDLNEFDIPLHACATTRELIWFKS